MVHVKWIGFWAIDVHGLLKRSGSIQSQMPVQNPSTWVHQWSMSLWQARPKA
jgi:hypothetical protein